LSEFSLSIQVNFKHSPGGVFMHLTKTELEVLEALSQGDNSHDIADARFRSQDTIKKHIKNAREKMGAKNIAHLIYLALKQDLIHCFFIVLICSQFFPAIEREDDLGGGDKARVRVSSFSRSGRVREDLV